MPATLVLVLLTAAVPPRDGPPLEEAGWRAVALDVRTFRAVEGPRSGPAVYYRVVDEEEGPVLQGHYEPGRETVTMGIEVPEPLRRSARYVRWAWRARAVPERGDECYPGRGDSAASVSLAFKRGLRWYILKYVWSGTSPLGAVCDRKRSIFLARDTIVLEHAEPRETWLRERVDVRRAFIDHFAGGDPRADVPELVGIGLMTDGDQTSSASAADWTGFEVVY